MWRFAIDARVNLVYQRGQLAAHFRMQLSGQLGSHIVGKTLHEPQVVPLERIDQVAEPKVDYLIR